MTNFHGLPIIEKNGVYGVDIDGVFYTHHTRTNLLARIVCDDLIVDGAPSNLILYRNLVASKESISAERDASHLIPFGHPSKSWPAGLLVEMQDNDDGDKWYPRYFASFDQDLGVLVDSNGNIWDRARLIPRGKLLQALAMRDQPEPQKKAAKAKSP